MPLPTEQLESGSGPVRIVIAAVQSSLRELLRKQLECEPWVQVVGDASDTRTACPLIRRLKPDILLIESNLNRELSMRCPSRASDTASTAGIVVIIETDRIQEIVEAFELGARGIVLRASLPPLWRTGIQSILAGQYWVENKSVTLLLEAIRHLLAQPPLAPAQDFGLTLREIEIAGKIATGLSNKEVSREFSICERTVKHHLTNIFKKVGVSSRLELAVLMRDKVAPYATVQPDKSLGKPDLYLIAEPR
jgi:two-component system nitrate/nitrite response regulator NarL